MTEAFQSIWNFSTGKHEQHERVSNFKVFQLSFRHSKNCARAKPAGGISPENRGISWFSGERIKFNRHHTIYIHLCANTPNISNAIQWHLAAWKVRKLQNRFVWQDDWISWKIAIKSVWDILMKVLKNGSTYWVWPYECYNLRTDGVHSRRDHRKTCCTNKLQSDPRNLDHFLHQRWHGKTASKVTMKSGKVIFAIKSCLIAAA